MCDDAPYHDQLEMAAGMLEHHIVVGGNALHSMAQPDICHAGPQSHGSCPPVPAFYSDFLPPAWQDSGRLAHHVGIGSNIQSVMDALGRKAILQALLTHTPPTGVHDLPSSMQQLPSKSARIPGAARASSSRQVLQSGTTIANLQAGDPHAIQTTPPPPPPRPPPQQHAANTPHQYPITGWRPKRSPNTPPPPPPGGRSQSPPSGSLQTSHLHPGPSALMASTARRLFKRPQ